MSTDYEYKPGMLGKIKDLVRKANEQGNGKKGSATAQSDNTKRRAKKQKSDGNNPKDKVPRCASSEGIVRAGKPTTSAVDSLDVLWSAAKTSKAKELKKEDQTQVWIDSKLYHKIEMLNLNCGKPVPTKHIVNAILQLYLDEHKTEILKASK